MIFIPNLLVQAILIVDIGLGTCSSVVELLTAGVPGLIPSQAIYFCV